MVVFLPGLQSCTTFVSFLYFGKNKHPDSRGNTVYFPLIWLYTTFKLHLMYACYMICIALLIPLVPQYKALLYINICYNSFLHSKKPHLFFHKNIPFILCKGSRKIFSMLNCIRLTHSDRKYIKPIDGKYTLKTFLSFSNKNIEKLGKVTLF